MDPWVTAGVLVLAGGGILAATWREQATGRELIGLPVTRLAPLGAAWCLLGAAFALNELGANDALAGLVTLAGLAVGVLTIVSLLWLPKRWHPSERTSKGAVRQGAPGEVTVKLSEDDTERWVPGTFPDRQAARQAARDALGEGPTGCATLYETRDDGSAAVVEVVDRPTP